MLAYLIQVYVHVHQKGINSKNREYLTNYMIVSYRQKQIMLFC